MASELIDVEEVSKRLDIAVQAVRSYAKKGLLQPAKIGTKRKLLFDSDYIDVYKKKNMQYNKDELLSTTQVANLLGVSYATVLSYTKKGLITPICTTLHDKNRYLKSDIDTFNKSLGETDIDSLYSTYDLSRLFSCHYRTIYYWKKLGVVKVVRVMPDGAAYYSSDSVERIHAYKQHGTITE